MRHITIAAMFAMLLAAACGDFDIRQGSLAGAAYCQDKRERFHFQTMVPPWKYNKEYKCTSMDGRNCVGQWIPTGRFVWVVSDIPFVNLDSEIVTLLNGEVTSGNTANLVRSVIIDKDIGQTGSTATLEDDREYPRELTFEEPGYTGHDVLWRQERSFEGRSYNWYRRDVYIKGPSGRSYHLEFYSIGSLDKPEFDALIQSFREGAAPDGAPECPCLDEHDPDGPQEC